LTNAFTKGEVNPDTSKPLGHPKEAFENDKDVMWVGKNRFFYPQAIPSDPLYQEAVNDKDYHLGY
jgi:hypothetical protein